MVTQAEYLIGRFGGALATARTLGHRNPTTVRGWKDRGTVPIRQFHLMLKVGETLDPPLCAQEYFESLDGEPHLLKQGEAA